VNPERSEHGFRGVEPRRGVVVPTDYDDLAERRCFPDAGQESVIEFERLGRRVHRLEDVPGD
jgi:hypothetical protein